MFSLSWSCLGENADVLVNVLRFFVLFFLFAFFYFLVQLKNAMFRWECFFEGDFG